LGLLELKLAFAREESEKMRAEYEKVRVEQEMMERAWQIEQQKMELGVVSSGTNGGAMQSGIRGDISRLLPKMSDSDPLIFFSAFERTLSLNEVPRGQWSKLLGSTLTNKAHKALTALSISEMQDYDKCKRIILDYYKLDSAEYLRRFRTSKRESGETHKMFKARLNDYLQYYIEAREATTFEKIYDDVLLQQLLCNMPTDVRNFVISKQPISADQASEFADLHSRMAGQTTGNLNQVATGGIPRHK